MKLTFKEPFAFVCKSEKGSLGFHGAYGAPVQLGYANFRTKLFGLTCDESGKNWKKVSQFESSVLETNEQRVSSISDTVIYVVDYDWRIPKYLKLKYSRGQFSEEKGTFPAVAHYPLYELDGTTYFSHHDTNLLKISTSYGRLVFKEAAQNDSRMFCANYGVFAVARNIPSTQTLDCDFYQVHPSGFRRIGGTSIKELWNGFNIAVVSEDLAVVGRGNYFNEEGVMAIIDMHSGEYWLTKEGPFKYFALEQITGRIRGGSLELLVEYNVDGATYKIDRAVLDIDSVIPQLMTRVRHALWRKIQRVKKREGHKTGSTAAIDEKVERMEHLECEKHMELMRQFKSMRALISNVGSNGEGEQDGLPL